MRKSLSKRRVIALAAVYLVALQALLLPLSLAAASPFAAPPCSTSANRPGNPPAGQPVGHDSGCPCAAGCGMQCCGHALATPAPDIAAPVPVLAFTTKPPLMPLMVALPPIRSPSIPRAPPAA